MDSNSRNRIVSEIDKNFFVEAGAGSGKTTMLVSRMVAMVEAGIPIEKICAITFTKAAAGEFYDRFQKMLIERSNPDQEWVDSGNAGQLPEPTDETRQNCAKALEDIDLCFMGTIDSFCNMVLSEHPSEAGIPSDSTIISDEDAEALYKQIYVRICAGDYDKQYPQLLAMADTFRAFHRNAEDAFAKLASFMMNNRNVDFKFTKNTGNCDIDTQFATVRDDLKMAIRFLAGNPVNISETNAETRKAKENIRDIYYAICRKWSTNLSTVIHYLNILSGIRVAEGCLNVPSVNSFALSKFFVKGVGKGAYDGSIGINIGLPGGLYSELDRLKYNASMDFVSNCIPVLVGTMCEKGRLTYFDYLYYLRQMLVKDAKKEGKLIEYIYDRHSYFLIDEFQDTNPMQAEIFFYLAAEDPKKDKWSDCVPKSGSIFVVGDPKQSIYRFRSADVTSYLKVKKLFEDGVGEVLPLSRNFRSSMKMCEYFNNVFSNVMSTQTADQSKFENIPLPNDTAGIVQGAYLYKSYSKGILGKHPNQSDPEQILKIVNTLVGDNNFKIKTKEDAEPRTIDYRDIMIITSTKTKLGPIMKILKENDIPVRVEGKVLFADNEALREVFGIYCAVTDTDDIISLYGALTGKLIRLTEDQLIRYRKADKRISLKNSHVKKEDGTEEGSSGDEAADKTLADETVRLIDEKLEMLRKLSLDARGLSPAALFTKIMEKFRVYKYVTADNMEVLCYTLELLRNAEKSGIVVTHKDGEVYITKLIADESDEERCLSLKENTNAVHMANLHKVKGLEAPVVILAAAVPNYNKAIVKRIEHKDGGSEGWLFELPKKSDGKNFRLNYIKTDEYAKELDLEKTSDKAEGLRLEYVAATRAGNLLIICDSIVGNATKEWSSSDWKELYDKKNLSDFFTSFKPGKKKAKAKSKDADSEKLYDEAEASCVLKDIGSIVPTVEIGNPSKLHIQKKILQDPDIISLDEGEIDQSETDDEAAPAGTVSAAHAHPALLGTMTHRLMELLVRTKGRINDDNAIHSILSEYIDDSISEPDTKELKAALVKVAATVRGGGYPQANGVAQDILNTLLNADEVHCEVPFCYSEEADGKTVIWNGVMDVLYCENGNWHIIDYKTNAEGTDLDKKYENQLEAYIRALKATTNEDADARIYHIDI
ncbi:MAG: UvrD-helicase domain-containing protein [Lachnospiraceae bacterium]|nr:UvrD-helicase domain-containing protein [Lachnospiraceae bacterium]